MSRAFVKESDGNPEPVAKRPQRQHPYFVTPEGFAQLQAELAAAQAAADEQAVEAVQERVEAAIVVRPEEQPRDRVAFGAGVTVEGPDRRRSSYRIVGEDEADPLHGTISWLSPLAQALLDHRKGDRVLWQRPAGNLPLKIVSISYS